MEPTFFATPADFHAWLEAHHATASELIVGFYKSGSGRQSITWPESVDEALCFGWIDGVRKGRDGMSYTICFTPRKPQSNWSAVNIRKVEELTALGRMRPAGLLAFERREASLSAEDEAAFCANAAAWDFFQAQPPSYRKAAVWWVISAK